MAVDKEFYNEASSTKLGWAPDWFGVITFGKKLTSAIRRFQRECGLHADGMCGPATFRRIWTFREANIADYVKCDYDNDGVARIVHNEKEFPIAWEDTVLWDDKGGLMAKLGNYSSLAGQRVRKPTMFVNHWDVCLNSTSCQRVLDRRGISVHFLIDNDGTIYQTCDTQNIAWHAGNINKKSIGVEISCAYDLKWQSYYVKNGFGERPIVKDAWVHGRKLKPHLGFYPIQLEALKALWKACHIATGIPLQTPAGREKDALCRDVAAGRYKGFVSHYHATKRKIDCGGLDIEKLLEDIK